MERLPTEPILPPFCETCAPLNVPGNRYVIVLPEARRDWKAVKVPEGAQVEIHDDFAFAVGYPAMGEDWEKEFRFE